MESTEETDALQGAEYDLLTEALRWAEAFAGGTNLNDGPLKQYILNYYYAKMVVELVNLQEREEDLLLQLNKLETKMSEAGYDLPE